jgi:hypothetical protein
MNPREAEGELDPSIRIRAPMSCEGVGTLDSAEDLATGERLAIRWLPLETSGESAVRALESLPSHRLLPRLRQTGQVGSAAFAAISCPDAPALASLLDAPLSPTDLCALGAEVAEALALLHESGVAHGELSADSLLILGPGQALLWDLPLVVAHRHTDRRSEERALGQLTRLAPYLSPERAQGMSATAAGDVYSLATLLCFAGGTPLPASPTTLMVVHQVANGRWRPAIPSELPAAVRVLLARMLSPDSGERPDAREVATVLGNPHQPVAIPPPPPADARPLRRTRPPPQGTGRRVGGEKHRRFALGLVSGLVAAALSLTAVGIFVATRDEPEVEPAVVPRAQAPALPAPRRLVVVAPVKPPEAPEPAPPREITPEEAAELLAPLRPRGQPEKIEKEKEKPPRKFAAAEPEPDEGADSSAAQAPSAAARPQKHDLKRPSF